MIAIRISYAGWPYIGFASQCSKGISSLDDAAGAQEEEEYLQRQRQEEEESVGHERIAANERVSEEAEQAARVLMEDESDNTVERHLWRALLRVGLVNSIATCSYSRAGRTDSGVSALGQVIGVRVKSNTTPPASGSMEIDYLSLLNSALPDDIRATSWAPAAEPVQDDREEEEGAAVSVREAKQRSCGFNARFDARWRAYKYFFFNGERLDISSMQDAARMFVGKHDFRNFCRMDLENARSFERTMLECKVRPSALALTTHDSLLKVPNDDDDNSRNGVNNNTSENEPTLYEIYIRGHAFLWHQVRCMAAVLFLVGRGCEHPSIVREMLNVHDETSAFHVSRGKPHYRLASELPLVLYDVGYAPDRVDFRAAGEQERLERAERRSLHKFSANERHVDAVLTRAFMQHAIKSAFFHEALLSEQRHSIVSRSQPVALSANQTAAPRRRARTFLLDCENAHRHAPLRDRPRQDSLELQRERFAATKKRRREHSL